MTVHTVGAVADALPGIGEIVRFTPSFEADAIADLRDRIRRARWSAEFANDDGDYGLPGRQLRELMEYWADGYPWDQQVDQLNRFAHFRTHIDGIPVHFLHVRGKGPDPMPLVLTHGWPETFWDFHEVIGPLTDPAAHGGDARDSFDLVIPSLPGFAYSSPLTTTGLAPGEIAPLWHALMTQTLGYPRFAAAGGDWGATTSTELALQFPDDVIGIHLTYPPRFHLDLEKLSPSDYAPDESDWPQRQAEHRERNLIHVPVHTQAPQTLAWALEDSPIGLAAWLLEARLRWSDSDGELEHTFSRDFLLTTLSLYWFTRTIGSSMRIYAESFRPPLRIHSRMPPPRVEVPTGIAVYPREMTLIPRAACERVVNLTSWKVHERGGHFAAAEQPGSFVDDLRDHFRPLRGQGVAT